MGVSMLGGFLNLLVEVVSMITQSRWGSKTAAESLTSRYIQILAADFFLHSRFPSFISREFCVSMHFLCTLANMTPGAFSIHLLSGAVIYTN